MKKIEKKNKRVQWNSRTETFLFSSLESLGVVLFVFFNEIFKQKN